jgi:hypothetical protein
MGARWRKESSEEKDGGRKVALHAGATSVPSDDTSWKFLSKLTRGGFGASGSGEFEGAVFEMQHGQ